MRLRENYEGRGVRQRGEGKVEAAKNRGKGGKLGRVRQGMKGGDGEGRGNETWRERGDKVRE